MALDIAMITFDCSDPDTLAQWWLDAVGGELNAVAPGEFVMVAQPSGLALGFQKVPDPTPGKNLLHFDLTADTDLDQAVRELLDAGATLVGDRGDESFRWVTLADPQGNQFCVAAGE